jgi:hypothetical protein
MIAPTSDMSAWISTEFGVGGGRRDQMWESRDSFGPSR